jgi:hypothetical protein
MKTNRNPIGNAQPPPMKIICYQDKQDRMGNAAQQADGSVLILAGDIYGSPELTTETAEVRCGR